VPRRSRAIAWTSVDELKTFFFGFFAIAFGCGR
jgi:hypothetical protein